MMRRLLMILLLSAAVFAAYPQTAGDVTDTILGCKNNPCFATTAACATGCDSDHSECFANCHGAQSACFNQCDIAQQACSEDCVLVQISCIQTCLNDNGFSACTSIYNIQNEQPFIACVLSHAPVATQTPTATPTLTPAASTTPACAGGIWNGTDCVPAEIPPQGGCGSLLILTGLGLLVVLLVAGRR